MVSLDMLHFTDQNRLGRSLRTRKECYRISKHLSNFTILTVDFNLMTTFEVCFSDKFVKKAANALEAYKRAGGDVTEVKFYEGEEAKARTRVPGALCAYEWTAASNHPGKLVQWILNDSIGKGVKL